MATNGSWSSICDGVCSTGFNGSSEAMLAWPQGGAFSLVLIDETADANVSSSTTHSASVLELAVRTSAVATGADHRWVLAAAMLSGGVAVAAWPKKSTDSGRKISEEE